MRSKELGDVIKSMVGALAVVLLAVGALLGAPGCGGDDDGGGGGNGNGPAMTECEPANSFSCVGSNGCEGVQICNRDGTWGSCNCGPSGQSGNGPIIGQGGNGPGGEAGDGEPGDGGAAGAPGTTDAGPGAAGDGAGGAAGDGAGGAAGDGAGGAGSGAGGSAAGDDEDCDNGEDDDGDGDVDCADEDCDERTCAREAPDGWLGPAVLFEGDVPDDCPNAYDDELARGGLSANADDADCDTCSCSPASPDCAANLRFSVGEDDSCGGTVCETALSASCINWSPSCLDGLSTAYLETEIGSGGSGCTPSAQSPSLPDAEWDDPMLACGADGLERNGCAAGRVCAPPLPDGAALCIVRSGDRACPSGAYSDRTVYYTDFDDNRSCSACECDQDCDYAWNVYQSTDTTCAMSPELTLVGEDQCEPVTPTSDALRIGVEIEGTGACDSSGGDPQGSVSEDGAVTVCCDR
jgi:hypothetical protein